MHLVCTRTCTLLIFKCCVYDSLGQTTSVWLVVVAVVALCFCFEVFLTLDNLHSTQQLLAAKVKDTA